MIDTDEDYLCWFCTKRFDEHKSIIRDGVAMGYQQENAECGLRTLRWPDKLFPTNGFFGPQSQSAILLAHLFQTDAFFAQLVS